MTVAPFVYADWSAAFPEFAATVTQPQATNLFNFEAPLYLNNTDASVVVCDPVTFQPRQWLLYLLTAHLAQIEYGSSKAAASPLVGRISTAAEGSVSVAAEMNDDDPAAAFYLQTPYGARYWAATRQYRTMQYVRTPIIRRGRRGY